MSKFETAADQLAALRADFPTSQVKTREERGETLHYLDAHTIQNRLLDVIGTGLSISAREVREHRDSTGKLRKLNVEVELHLRWVDGTYSTVSGYGSADALYARADPDKVVNDYLKSAYTDGIKVAASKLGVGLSLYSKEYRDKLGDAGEEETVSIDQDGDVAIHAAIPVNPPSRFRKGK